MTSVFISYSSKDREVAEFVKSELEKRGASVFIDYQRLIGGEDFTERLALEIERADFIVCLLSEFALNSGWVRDELQFARRRNKVIKPLKMDKTPIPYALFFLESLQFISFERWYVDKQVSEAINKLLVALGIVSNPLSHVLITASNVADLRELKMLIGHEDRINSLAFSPNGKYLASASKDCTVRLWDLETFREIKEFDAHTDNVSSICFSTDGKLLATASNDTTVRLWNMATRKEISSPLLHASKVDSIAFSPDGEYIACGCRSGEVRLWSVSQRVEKHNINFKPRHLSFNAINKIAFSPNGEYMALVSDEPGIKLWDMKNQSEIRFPVWEDASSSLTFSPNGNLLASGGFGGFICVWEVDKWKEKFNLHFEVPDKDITIDSVAFSPDGDLIVGASENAPIHLWDVETGRKLGELKGHTDWVKSVCFSPDGTLLASGSDDCTIRLWGCLSS